MFYFLRKNGRIELVGLHGWVSEMGIKWILVGFVMLSAEGVNEN
jgi:hypothetical protein